jgi:hypothetical protein
LPTYQSHAAKNATLFSPYRPDTPTKTEKNGGEAHGADPNPLVLPMHNWNVPD